MIQVGDHFIYRSKYGGLVEGIIGEIIEVKVINLKTGYTHRRFRFKSTNNVIYKKSEIEFVDRKLSEKEIEDWKKFTEDFKNYKLRKKEQLTKFAQNLKENENNKERTEDTPL